jgi:hypothetical protein
MGGPKSTEDAATVVIGLVFACALIYGMYWVFKTVSYSFFYESMVIETIHEQVKPEYLIKQ